MLHRPSPDPAPPGAVMTVGFVGSIGRCCFSDLLLRTCPALDTAYSSASRTALLAALAAGELDVAVYPGEPAPGIATTLLCLDRIVVAMRAGHYLSRGRAIDAGVLRERAVLLPGDGGESDFRRLAQGLLPGLARVSERPMRDIAARLQTTDAVALVAAGEADAISGAIVTADIANVDTRFAVQLGWRPPLGDTAFHRLLAALGV